MPRQRVIQVDAFAERPFAGNPAAVCVLVAPMDPTLMQQIGLEMNLSETAFLLPLGEGRWNLRWFTPTVEVDLCGHATLASAHVLWTDVGVTSDTLQFETRSGTLTARRTDERIELDFPAVRVQEEPAPPGLLEALGRPARTVARNRMDWLVEFESADDVRATAPAMDRLAAIPARGVIVTAASDDDRYDFISRFFGPGSGVPEDPVTGSAHCALAPFWSDRLGRTTLTGYQASARGGVVGTEVAGERVRLRGSAVTVLHGELLL
jgi:predicted PhzF superfamily epimerase YddE/YHI9